jgi:multidrug resistance protein, MATE family
MPAGLWRAEFRATALLAWPMIMANLTGTLISATDVFLLGKLGPQALAAGAIGANFSMSIMIFGMGLVTAATPLMAAEIGRRRNAVREVQRTFRQALWAAVLFTIPIWILLWNAETLFLALGQKPAVAADAALFVRGLQWGILPYLFYLVMRSFVAALERPIWVLIVGGLAVITNAILNYGLILGHFGLPQMGVLGAGIGSSITETILFGGMAMVVLRHRQFRRFRLFDQFWKPDWPRLAEILRLGWPIALQMGFEATVFSAAILLMGWISTADVAAYGIALQICAISFMVPLGVAQAGTVRVGLGYGRGDRAMIHRAGWAAFVLGVGFMAMMALVMWGYPRTLMGLFIDASHPDSAAVIKLGVSFLAMAALFQIFDGAQVVGAGMLRGLQDTNVPMWIALFSYWVVCIGTGYWLAFEAGLGGIGVWIGFVVGLGMAAALMMARWQMRARLGLVP